MTDARPRTHGHPGYSVTMRSELETVAEARRLVRQSCDLWAFDEEAAETAALLMSELVSNAVRHGRSHSIRVIVSCPAADRVKVAVVDKRRCLPEMHMPQPDAVGGRGLVLVDALSERWGTDLLPWGKRCWAEIRVKSEAAR
ncbi:ATP-binding protein [Streptomyces violascens]|uniref:ATP-binding protein n=1 Tax=Streptomyces violascens TaxID=67381 RepID=UPI0036B46303